MTKNSYANLFNYKSLRGKIPISLVLLTLLLVVLSIFLVQTHRSLNRQQNVLLKKNQPSQSALLSLLNSLNTSNKMLQEYALYNEIKYKDERVRIWDYDIERTLDSLDAYSAYWKNIDNKILYENIKTDLAKLRETQNKIEAKPPIIQQLVNEILLDTSSVKKIIGDPSLLEEITSDINFGRKVLSNPSFIENFAANAQGATNDFFDLDAFEEKNEASERLMIDNLFSKKYLTLSETLQKNIDQLKQAQNQELQADIKWLQQQSLRFDFILIACILLFVVTLWILFMSLQKTVQKNASQINYYTHEMAYGNLPEIEMKEAMGFEKIYFNLRTLSRRLQSFVNYTDDISKSVFLENDVFHKNSTIGLALSKMEDEIKNLDQQDKIRAWLKQGIDRFTQILNAQYENQVLFDKIVAELVRITSANIGGLYMINQQENELHLVSCFAYERKKYIKQHLKYGQGLVGQVWQEGEKIHLTQLPKNYMPIASGLGEEVPQSVLIVPIKIANEVLGIIELASLKRIPAYEVDFVEQISEYIGSSLSSIRSKAHTENLLKESKKTTERMLSQEQEMRNHLEQLAASEEEVTRKNIELDAMLDIMDQSVLIMELSPNGNIKRISKVFAELLGYPIEELIKMNLSYFLTKEHFAELMTHLKEDTEPSHFLTIRNHDLAEITLQVQVFPIADSQEKIISLVCVCEKLQLGDASQTLSLPSNPAIDRLFLIIETDADYKIQKINQNALQLLDIPIEDYKSKHIDALIIGRIDYKVLTQELSNEEKSEGIVLLRTSDKGFKFIKFDVLPSKREGEIVSINFIGTDITQQKLNENELRLTIQNLKNNLEKLKVFPQQETEATE